MKINQKKKTKNNRLIKYGIYLSLLLLTAGLIYQSHQSNLALDEWNKIQQVFQSEPGLVITDTLSENGEYLIRGLADPLAIKPSLLIKHGTLKNIEVVLSFKPYLSLEADIVLRRIHEKFDIPDSVKLSLNDEVLSLSGKSTSSWLKQFKSEASRISGVNSLNTNKIELVR